MIDFIVGLFVVIIVGAALLYIRKEKKKGGCVGCPYSVRCQKHHYEDANHSCGCHTDK